jgi:hypothetical protein
LSNAVKFAERGSVTLVARAARLPENRYALTLAVRDTGRGIAHEDQQRIFEPFVQADNTGANEGTGLGLTISREFVRMMGGRLEVESEPGQGAEFRFTIEVEAAGAAPFPAAGAAGAQDPAQRAQPSRPQPLTEAALAQLPYDVLVGVKEALHLLYTARALELLETCRGDYPDIVQAVVTMLEHHQYPQLCGMIEAVCAAPEV